MSWPTSPLTRLLLFLTALAIISGLFDLLIGVNPLLSVGNWIIAMCCASIGYELGRRLK